MSRKSWVVVGLVASSLVVVGSARVIRSLIMTRGGVATFVSLVASANAQDLQGVRSLCTRRYLEARRIDLAPEGGVVGLPRNIHKNFRAWTEGQQVWLCPRDRVGPVYRFVLEGGAWKFDGLVGLLRAGGRVDSIGEGDVGDAGGSADFL